MERQQHGQRRRQRGVRRGEPWTRGGAAREGERPDRDACGSREADHPVEEHLPRQRVPPTGRREERSGGSNPCRYALGFEEVACRRMHEPRQRGRREKREELEGSHRRPAAQRERSQFEQLHARVLDRVARVPCHERRVVTPQPSSLLPEGGQREQMVIVRPPVLLYDRLGAPQARDRAEQQGHARGVNEEDQSGGEAGSQERRERARHPRFETHDQGVSRREALASRGDRPAWRKARRVRRADRFVGSIERRGRWMQRVPDAAPPRPQQHPPPS